MIQDTGNRLISALEKQTEKIIYFCSAENISPNLAVHEIRKSYKRLRALLTLFTDCNANFTNDYRKEIKEAGKLLSPIRESFVNVKYFDSITAGSNLIAEKKIRQVKDILSERNRLLIEDDFIGKEFNQNIIQFIKKFQLQLIELKTNCPSISQLKEQILSTFILGYENYKGTEQDLYPASLHELRKLLKRLWYQLDFVKFMHPRYFRMKSDQLNKITEQLGIDHDLFVFIEELKTGKLEFSDEEMLILENQVNHQRELNIIKLMPRLRQFFNETPELFEYKMDKIFKAE